MALNSRHIFCFFALQIMLAAQVIMAQHFTVHFMEEAHITFHTGHGHPGQHDHKTDQVCQICVLAKGLQNGLSGTVQVVPVVTVAFNPVLISLQSLEQEAIAGFYQARAPPVLS